MKALVSLLALAISSLGFSLNLPSITHANLRKIEEGMAYARASNIEYVRFHDAMVEATKTNKLDVSAHFEVGKLAKKYGRKVVYLSYMQIPNTRYWRAIYRSSLSREAQANGDLDRQIFDKWISDEQRGNVQDLKNPKGIYPQLWKGAVETSQRLYDAFCRGYGGRVMRQIDNEPGNISDARLSRDHAYGEVPQPVRAFFAYWIPRAKGILCSPPWETQTKQGLSRQIAAENMADWSVFQYQSLNWYFTRWQRGDTPESWARRCVGELNVFVRNEWKPKRDIILTELGAIDSPRHVRRACYDAFMRIKPANVAAVNWFDYDSKDWGMK